MDNALQQLKQHLKDDISSNFNDLSLHIEKQINKVRKNLENMLHP